MFSSVSSRGWRPASIVFGSYRSIARPFGNKKASRVERPVWKLPRGPRWLPALRKKLLHYRDSSNRPASAHLDERSRRMADYTLVNLKEVEDQAPRFGLSPNWEIRMARVALELQQSGVSYQRLEPNFRLPFGHKHKRQEEVYVLIGGSVRIKLEDEVVELKPLDAVRVHQDTMRGLDAGRARAAR